MVGRVEEEAVVSRALWCAGMGGGASGSGGHHFGE